MMGLSGLAQIIEECSQDLFLDRPSGSISASLAALQTACCRAGQNKDEVPWNESELVFLHTDLFYSSLDALRGLTNENVGEKQEILDWIFEPDVVVKKVDGLKILVYALDIPFSFARCCKMLGYQPDRIRSGLEERVKALHIQFVPASRKQQG